MFCSTPIPHSSKGHNNCFGLEDENGNIVPWKDLTSNDLRNRLKELQFGFELVGKKVKDAVNLRAELLKELDAQKERLMQLQVEEDESGIDDIDENDPLRFIDCDYPFFHDAVQCDVELIGNREDPKRCTAAMDDFVKVIHDNVHRFKHLPKGPLYKEIRLRVSSTTEVQHSIKTRVHCMNKRWAPLAEYVLRPYLFSFLVDNIVDGIVMSELIEQHFPSMEGGSVNRNGVICPKFHFFAFQSTMPTQSRISSISGLELENLLESMHFDDEDWGKFLSQVLSVEKIVFMENENAAFLVMSHIRKTPWHCKMAYTLDGFCVYPFPNFRTRKIGFHPRPMYLKCIPNIEIMELSMKIRRTEAKLRANDNVIHEKRSVQMEMARRIDKIGILYAETKAQEKEHRAVQKKTVKKTKKVVQINRK